MFVLLIHIRFFEILTTYPGDFKYIRYSGIDVSFIKDAPSAIHTVLQVRTTHGHQMFQQIFKPDRKREVERSKDEILEKGEDKDV